jgi:23S rRNA pseudouridine1911/1915/1917 synthase
VVHPSVGHYKDTLVNALLFHIKDLSSINGVIRPGIVHRIDKDTTGLLVVAKNDFAHVKLQEQLKDKTMYRKYYALAYGKVDADEGKIDAPIGRDPKDRQKMTVIGTGKEAVTNFKVLERFSHHTLLECRLETGRTHQIRVHLNYIGNPIISDPMYGTRKLFDDNGQYLHAFELSFIHPRTNERVSFNAPLPAYFEEFLKVLRGNPQ